jgi:hypothetical protein
MGVAEMVAVGDAEATRDTVAAGTDAEAICVGDDSATGAVASNVAETQGEATTVPCGGRVGIRRSTTLVGSGVLGGKSSLP